METPFGSICEVYDAVNPKRGKGAFAQAWSVAEIFKILLDNWKVKKFIRFLVDKECLNEKLS